MTLHKATLTWDDQKHTVVHLGMANHEGETDAAYLRKCVEFYEANGGTLQLILQEIAALKHLIQRGVVVASGDDPADDHDATDEIFDDLLEQFE